MKDTLIETKNNLQGNNSRVDELRTSTMRQETKKSRKPKELEMNILQGIISGIDGVEDQIRNLEDKETENT